jgi:hypothetical protein
MNFPITATADLSALANLDQLLADNAEKGIRAELARTVKDFGGMLIFEWTKGATIALKNPGKYMQMIDDGKIYPFEDDPLHFVIINDHPAAVYFEQGYDPFDMRKMLAAHGKTAKDGTRYMRIPFGHSQGEMVRAGISEDELKEMTATERRHVPMSAGDYVFWKQKTFAGDRLTDLGDVGKRRKYFSFQTGDLARREGIYGRKTVDYTWKSSKFEGAQKFVDNAGTTKGFMTFRTISEKSDPDAWIHPGLRAMHIAGHAVETIAPLFINAVAETVEKAFRQAGFPTS